jgi:PilZ domain
MSCYDRVTLPSMRKAVGGSFRSQMNIERRLKARYPIELAVCYQPVDDAQGTVGTGRSLNMSSSGLLVSCQARFAAGTPMKVTLEWPSLLDGTTPLQLVTVGRVARSDEASFAMTFEHYQFRTMRRRNAALAAAAEAAGQSVLADASASGASTSNSGPDSGTLRRAG